MSNIVKGLINLVRRIGKWILDVAARRGGSWLADYIEERAGVFQLRMMRAAKRKSAAAKRRVAWLKGRISRWNAAAKWLRENAKDLDNVVIDNVASLPAVKKLPETAAGEIEKAFGRAA